MQNAKPSLLTRPDTLLGVCEGLGEDLRINAQYLRVALAVVLFVNPVAAIGIYAVAGVAVLLSRWLYPEAVTAGASEPLGAVEPASAEAAPLRGENDERPVELAAAA
jgi:phage shock protein C